MDKYDHAIAYLRERPDDILDAWCTPTQHPAGCLFALCGRGCGCLTQVRTGYSAATPELTAAIRADERIPGNPANITVDDLPVFAEWQRRLDAELNRG